MSGMDRLTELLPCPFCGGEADTMTPEADDMRAATVMCMGCYCTGKECETEAQAIAAWNRRASQAAPAPSDGLREAWIAGRDAAAAEAFYACGCKDSIEALTPPAAYSRAAPTEGEA